MTIDGTVTGDSASYEKAIATLPAFQVKVWAIVAPFRMTHRHAYVRLGVFAQPIGRTIRMGRFFPHTENFP
ncbi:hypothetical protein [Bifidobacterium lemurum]|uniref:hypothetical protein n=1 Tax=Bifidobacterium lemurum TaxID=1603886 RepID=UPI00139666E8|nr:hypothetical protein [Bifidobacterium lemurum]